MVPLNSFTSIYSTVLSFLQFTLFKFSLSERVKTKFAHETSDFVEYLQCYFLIIFVRERPSTTKHYAPIDGLCDAGKRDLRRTVVRR